MTSQVSARNYPDILSSEMEAKYGKLILNRFGGMCNFLVPDLTALLHLSMHIYALLECFPQPVNGKEKTNQGYSWSWMICS